MLLWTSRRNLCAASRVVAARSVCLVVLVAGSAQGESAGTGRSGEGRGEEATTMQVLEQVFRRCRCSMNGGGGYSSRLAGGKRVLTAAR